MPVVKTPFSLKKRMSEIKNSNSVPIPKVIRAKSIDAARAVTKSESLPEDRRRRKGFLGSMKMKKKSYQSTSMTEITTESTSSKSSNNSFSKSSELLKPKIPKQPSKEQLGALSRRRKGFTVADVLHARKKSKVTFNHSEILYGHFGSPMFKQLLYAFLSCMVFAYGSWLGLIIAAIILTIANIVFKSWVYYFSFEIGKKILEKLNVKYDVGTRLIPLAIVPAVIYPSFNGAIIVLLAATMDYFSIMGTMHLLYQSCFLAFISSFFVGPTAEDIVAPFNL
mmetsp:Transcript_2285/g.2562  ORF Transcript_2285/g.2562 Transcript_2285/m.2562 type:complete len:280 (+) Transcript_2285:1-840(+)